jgi:hypothetical protein
VVWRISTDVSSNQPPTFPPVALNSSMTLAFQSDTVCSFVREPQQPVGGSELFPREEIVVPDRGDLATPLQRRIAISDSNG